MFPFLCVSPFGGLQQFKEIKVPFAENLELSKGLLLKRGVGQNVALHALSAAMNSPFLISDFLIHSSHLFINTL